MKQGKPINLIAIDGPGGVGKSSVSHALAERLGYYFLSSGMIYRAMAWYMLHNAQPRWSPQDEPNLAALDPFHVRIDASGSLWINDVPMADGLHTEENSKAASLISAYPDVRKRADQVQRDTVRRIEEEQSYPGVILEGRDIGTVVFPAATHKFFLTASEEVRAERRFKEQQADDPALTLAAVREALRERDGRDESRDVAPLKAAPDAEVIDTSQLSQEQVVNRMWAKVTGAASP
ncbi:MAG: (d)CMP kinase [SAR324 cluster bacterium]|nr:(d)CMP kinase [SAR324 cluster bacterium]